MQKNNQPHKDKEMKEFIIGIAKAAGDIAMLHIEKAQISFKGEKNIVTDADKAVEKFIIGKIKEKFPSHNIVGEESGNENKKSEFNWFIDPIDGTNNYAHKDANFCISIALEKGGEIIYACVNIPKLNEIYYAEKGKGAELNGNSIHVSNIEKLQDGLMHIGIRPFKKDLDLSIRLIKHFTVHADRARDYGFTAGEMAFISAGKAEGCVKLEQNAWDIAAGILLIEEAGGKVTDFEGNKVTIGPDTKSYLVASNKLLHSQILDHVKKVKNEEEN